MGTSQLADSIRNADILSTSRLFFEIPLYTGSKDMKGNSMATNAAQRRWRAKNRFTKTQLNVMARRLVHDDLDEIARVFQLRGKAEAVAFSAFAAKGLIQYAGHNEEAQRLLTIFVKSWFRDRDLYG
ncbi:MAG: hypothetical protein ABFS30_01560 [Pseudomonadota bacterium]